MSVRSAVRAIWQLPAEAVTLAQPHLGDIRLALQNFGGIAAEGSPYQWHRAVLHDPTCGYRIEGSNDGETWTFVQQLDWEWGSAALHKSKGRVFG